MRKIIWILICAFVGTILIGYAYGFLSHRNDLFPYPQIKLAYSIINQEFSAGQLHDKVEKLDLDSNINLKTKIGLELSALISDRRVIETLTVPALATVVDVGALDNFGEPSAKGAKGGLCSTGSSLIVFDGAGNGLLIDMHSLTLAGHLSVEDFENRSGGEFVRVNDVACDRSPDPAYAYVSYEIMDPDLTDRLGKYRSVVGRVELRGFQDSSVVELWSSALTGENEAGRLALLPDGKFLLTFSDNSGGNRQANGLFGPEDAASLMGKVVLADPSTGDYEIISMGHRNPQGLFVTDDGRIFETEHGPKGGDELNIIIKGGNYGWPNETHGVDYISYRWKHGDPGRHDNYDQPIFAWVPSIAISNLLEVRNFHSSWRGDILISSLKAQSLFRVRLDDARRVEFVEQIWIGPRIRDIEETDDARLVLWTDDSTLIFLSVASEFIDADERTELSYTAAPALKACLNCHHFGFTNITHMAPSLSRIFSRKIASDNFKYSAALASQAGKWQPETLKEYILDPQSVARGSTMTYQVENEKVAREIVELLINLDNMSQ
jgi:cytochrome c2